MPSFTQRINNLQQVGPVVEIRLTPSTPYLKAMNISSANVKAIKVLAMIDTGTSGTVISQGLAAVLDINPVGTTRMATPSAAEVLCSLV